MEELIWKMIRDLRKQTQEKVPEEGYFPVVYERYENPDKNVNLSHLILKVSAVPIELKGGEKERYLEFAVLNYPNQYGCEKVMKFGSTQDILAALQNEETLFQKIMEAIPQLESNLEDM